MSQNFLLKIVKKWKINRKPEYRGFRCGGCQKYLHKAWHHWLKKGGYKTLVHFCNSCERKFKPKGIYKNFTCDKCGRKMQKAYHVWKEKNGILIEDHFCKECGDKLGLNIKGVIYDLDGTIVSTTKLHELGWLYAGKKFNIKITKKMLIKQSGISNTEASLIMLPENKKYLVKNFITAKTNYINQHINQIKAFPNILETIKKLTKEGYRVWIFTAAHKNFVKEVLKIIKGLKIIKNNIIWCEFYKKGKPFPEGLNLTIKKMGLKNSEVYYIGDTFNDHKTSKAAGVRFIYFCSNIKNKDLRIPKSVPVISSHKEIFRIL